ncbi:MAG: hypothetical protein AAB706_00545 [Patescibacteria group bacterium]
MEEEKKRTSNFKLYDKLRQVYNLLDSHVPPSHQNEKGIEENSICAILKTSSSALSYYLKMLRISGFIEKRGMVWEIKKEFDEKQLQKSIRVDNESLLTLNQFPKDKNRGHGFQLKVMLGKIPGWYNFRRRKLLDRKEMTWYPLKHLVGEGEGIIFKGRKIHITNSSIIVYETASYISDLARVSESHAIYDILHLVKQIEKIFQANLFPNGQIKFKVTKQHHAMIKNSLAKQYNDKKKKLEIWTGRGLTYLIDNSFDINEFEGVHPKTSPEDMDDKVIPFFKSLDKDPMTTTEIKDNFSEFSDRVKKLSENDIKLSQVLEGMQKNLVLLTKEVADLKFRKDKV